MKNEKQRPERVAELNARTAELSKELAYWADRTDFRRWSTTAHARRMVRSVAREQAAIDAELEELGA